MAPGLTPTYQPVLLLCERGPAQVASFTEQENGARVAGVTSAPQEMVSPSPCGSGSILAWPLWDLFSSLRRLIRTSGNAKRHICSVIQGGWRWRRATIAVLVWVESVAPHLVLNQGIW